MPFFLFILANAMLFIRPSELIAGMGDVELYRYVIVACLIVALPIVLQQLTVRYAGVPPVAGCVLALLPAVLLSNLSHGHADHAVDNGTEFVKILVYFLLLLGLVVNTERLRKFTGWLCVFCAALAVISVLRYHADLEGPAPAPRKDPDKKLHGTFVVDQVYDPQTGAMVDVQRMCGTGIFNDPNDLALMLVSVLPLCLYWLFDPKAKALRPLWLGLLFVFGYAILQTHSRGGFLALLGGLVTLFYLRYGGKKMLLPALLALPVVFVAFAGRMTSITTSEGTGQSRIQLWSDGLGHFQSAPLFGIGMEGYRSLSEHVAHNSFIHCYAELGLCGGTLFVAAFTFALAGLFRLRNADPLDDDPELRRLYPYLVAFAVSYTIGISFLSRSYVVPTYMVLGLVTAYFRLYAAQARLPLPDWRRFLVPRLAGIGFGFLVAAYLFVRVFMNAS